MIRSSGLFRSMMMMDKGAEARKSKLFAAVRSRRADGGGY